MHINHRRSKQRVYPSHSRVAWSTGGERTLAPARIRDLSESGIGLTITGPFAGGMGEPIRIVGFRWNQPRMARIVRVSTHGVGVGNETTVGCRWVSGEGRRRSVRGLGPSPRGVNEDYTP